MIDRVIVHEAGHILAMGDHDTVEVSLIDGIYQVKPMVDSETIVDEKYLDSLRINLTAGCTHEWMNEGLSHEDILHLIDRHSFWTDTGLYDRQLYDRMAPADIKYDVTMAIKMINKMTPTFDIEALYEKI